MKLNLREAAPFRRLRRHRPGIMGVVAVLSACALPSVAIAQVESETQFVLSTFSFLIWGALVMWMCAGFTMLESGSVRTKNASVICLKNIGLYSIAGLTFYLVGYNLMYVGVAEGGWFGTLGLFYGTTPDEIALLQGQEGTAEAVVANGYSTMSDWFFQMVFVATTASIVSGTLAERVKLWSFLVFVAVLTAVIYPIVGSWTWGGGWLSAMGFQDFAGSTIVHSTGGWAALAGALIVGPRKGKFRADGMVKSTPPSNVPAVTLGVFILWPRLVRLQRRLPVGAGRRHRRSGREQHPGQHESSGRGRRADSHHRVAADTGAHRSAGRAQRRHCRTGRHHRRPGYRGALLGHRHRRGRRRDLRRGPGRHGTLEGGRCRRARFPPTCSPACGARSPYVSRRAATCWRS